jgi:hypothetical protein
MTRNRFRALAAIAALVAVVLVAVPVLGVDPSAAPSSDPSDAPASIEPSAEASASSEAVPSAEPSAEPSSPPPAPTVSAAPDEADEGEQENGKPENAAKPAKGAKTPEHPVTVTGIVGRSADDEGDYSLTSGLTIYKLSAGPKWWWGDANPLEDVVSSIVTIDGEQAEGSDEIDVLKINGKAIREPGKPPWAGGWKVVGEKHPGWAQWKVDKLAGSGLGHGRDSAPGQLKNDDPEATP